MPLRRLKPSQKKHFNICLERQVPVRGANGYEGGDLERSAFQNLFFAPSASFTLFNVCGTEGHFLLPKGGEAHPENPV